MTAPHERIVLGPSEGAKSGRMVAWAVGAIVAFGAGYVCLTMVEPALPALAAVGGVAGVLCVVGVVAAARHEVSADETGITVRQLGTTHIPWPTVRSVRLERQTVKTPAMYDETTRQHHEGDVIISSLVLLAELRNGKRVRLPIRVAEGTMTATRVAELARMLDQLRLAATP